MGGIAKVFGGGKKSAPAPAPTPVPEPTPAPVQAGRGEREAAAARRARRAGRRSLLGGGRLGSGQDEGQTTLGAG